jgi:hypothetical protein
VSDDAKKKKGKDKASKDKKGKKGESESNGGLSLSNHPRAGTAIRSLKGWGGVIGFVLAAVLSAKAGVPVSVLGLRAIVAGLLGYMVAWCCGVAAWRAIVTAEADAAMDHETLVAADAARASKAAKARG